MIICKKIKNYASTKTEKFDLKECKLFHPIEIYEVKII
ncbi:hypothetical protein CAAU_1510 [Caloramator australicus RC3]|uniref:Uncharacterized protein n=1 Tax=Caloramator australicus RC3 TaxID=857293 RepID=I7K7T2_9CLOT|nr:hypothetical protein CAAU_1510 [Caloramator australicus RC3]